MERQYLYLVPFKPAMLKKKALQRWFDEQEGVNLSLFNGVYKGARIESERQLSTGWILGTLSEYGETGSDVQEYTYTSDPEALPSRMLTDEEAQKLETQMRKAYTSGNLGTTIVLTLMTVVTLGMGIIYGSIASLLAGLVCLAVLIFTLWLHKRDRAAQAEMTFDRNDYLIMEGICCNRWTEEHEVTRQEDDKTITESVTSYYYEMAVGDLAFSHTFYENKQIGAPCSFIYDRKNHRIQ